jgi:hypothetical protein
MEGFAMNLPKELAVQYCAMKKKFWEDFLSRVEAHYGNPPAEAGPSGVVEEVVVAGEEEPARPIEKKKKKATGKEDGEEDKKKRGPSPYNLFIGEKLKEIRLGNPNLEHKEVFRMAIEMWKSRDAPAANPPTVDPQNTCLEEVLN